MVALKVLRVNAVENAKIDATRLDFCPLIVDTSSESEYESSQGSVVGSDCDEDEPSQNLEPEPSEPYDEYKNTPWNPAAQLQAQLHTAQLAQLHADIKARAELPDPTYEKLSRS